MVARKPGDVVGICHRSAVSIAETLRAEIDEPARVFDGLDSLRATLENGSRFPIVVIGDDPEWVSNALEVARAADVPTVVAPPTGSERLATVAIRGGAEDYVPLGDAVDASDRVTQVLETAKMELTDSVETVLDIVSTTLPDEVFVLDAFGTYLDNSVRPDSADLYTASPEELIGQTLWDAFDDDKADQLYGVLEAALEGETVETIRYELDTTEGIRQFEARVIPITDEASRNRVVWLARDLDERDSRELALQQRRDRLDLLDRINSAVHRVVKTLVEAPTQAAVEREVCDQLVASDLYCGAWVSHPSGDGDVVYQTGSGSAQSYLEAIQELDLDQDRPVTRALRENRIHSSNELLTGSVLSGDLLEAAREHDVNAAIAVPLAHGDSVHGVLTVLATRTDAFGDREKEAFTLLGDTIGFAISAIKNRRLLFADAVTLLEVSIEGGDSLAFDLTRKYDCQCTLEWSGGTADGQTCQYVRLDGLDGQTLLEEARAHETVEECRLIHDGETSGTIEIRLSESAVRTLMGYGATIRDVTVEDGEATVTVEVSRDTPTREIIEALQRVYENTRLISKREVDRSVMTAADRRNRILDRLTERQLTALRVAYYGGYFDWPRGSTGEEIAEAMDISPPTMHQHLRRGLEELLADFFDAENVE